MDPSAFRFVLRPRFSLPWSLAASVDMALCAVSFPGHVNRAAASDAQRNASLSSHFVWGSDLLVQSQHNLAQVFTTFAPLLCYFLVFLFALLEIDETKVVACKT